MSGRALFLALVVSLSFSGETRAQGPATAPDNRATAAALLDEGNLHFAAGRFEAALARYEAAYRIFPSAKIFLNLASAQRSLGHPVLAAEYYRRFLAESGYEADNPLHGEAERALEALEGEVARLSIDGSPRGAIVRLNGAAAGELPLPEQVLDPGTHRIELEAEGFSGTSTSVVLARGERRALELKLSPIAADVAPIAVTSPPAEEDPITSRWWFWTAIALGAAAGATAIVAASSGENFVPAGELGVSSTSEWRTK